MEPWHRLPRAGVESPSLETFKTRLDAVLCSLLWVTLLGQGVGLGDPQRALPAPTILGFWDSVKSSQALLLHTFRESVCVWGGNQGARNSSFKRKDTSKIKASIKNIIQDAV